MQWFRMMFVGVLLILLLGNSSTIVQGQPNPNAPIIVSDTNSTTQDSALLLAFDQAKPNVTFKVRVDGKDQAGTGWNSTGDALKLQDLANGIFQMQKAGFAIVKCTFQNTMLQRVVRVFVPSKIVTESTPFSVKAETTPEAGSFRSYTLDVDVGTLETITIKEEGDPNNPLPFAYPSDPKQPGNQALPTLGVGDETSTYIAVTDVSGKPLKNGVSIPLAGGYPQFRVNAKQETDHYTKLLLTLGATKYLIKVNVVKPHIKLDNSVLSLMMGTKETLSKHVTLVDKAGNLLDERGNFLTWTVDDNTNQNSNVKLNPPAASDAMKDYQLEALTAGGPVTLTVTYRPDANKPPVDSASLKVTVMPPHDLVTGITFDQPPILLVDDTQKIRIRFVDGYGKIVDTNTRRALQLQTDPHYLTAYLDPEDPNGRTLVVRAVQQGQTPLTITFTDETTNTSKSVTITINIVTIAGFDRLRVELHQMDSQTAADAFGRAVANEFYVVQAAINNNLKPRSGDGQGAGVLIYSDTFETYVRMQQRPILRGNNARMAADGWKDITVEDQRENAVNPTRNLYVDIPLRRRVALREAGDVGDPFNLKSSTSSQQSGQTNMASGEKPGRNDKTDTILKFRVPLSQLYFQRNSQNSAGGNLDLFDAHTIDGIVYDSRGRAVRAKIIIESLDSRLYSLGSNKFRPLEKGHFMVKVTLQEEDSDKTTPNEQQPPAASGKAMPPTNTDSHQGGTATNSTPGGTRSPQATEARIEYEGTMYVTAEEPDTKRPYLFRYRPYTFDLMNATFEARVDRNPVNQTFKALNLFSQVLGFLSGFTRLSRNIDDVAKFNSLYASSFIPALQKLFPTMNEAQRQNLLDRAMRYREEVPYGSQISRVLFFPKGAFTGLLSGQQARIIAINEHLYSVEVAIISSKTNANGGDNPPTGTNAASIPAGGNINQ